MMYWHPSIHNVLLSLYLCVLRPCIVCQLKFIFYLTIKPLFVHHLYIHVQMRLCEHAREFVSYSCKSACASFQNLVQLIFILFFSFFKVRGQHCKDKFPWQVLTARTKEKSALSKTSFIFLFQRDTCKMDEESLEGSGLEQSEQVLAISGGDTKANLVSSEQKDRKKGRCYGRHITTCSLAWQNAIKARYLPRPVSPVCDSWRWRLWRDCHQMKLMPDAYSCNHFSHFQLK